MIGESIFRALIWSSLVIFLVAFNGGFLIIIRDSIEVKDYMVGLIFLAITIGVDLWILATILMYYGI